MALIVSHLTGLRLLSSPRTADFVKGAKLVAEPASQIPFEAVPRLAVESEAQNLVARLGPVGEALRPLDVLVPRSSNRERCKVNLHSWQGDLPAGGILKVEEGLYICSPELCFLQMAPQLDSIDLMMLGASMAGRAFPADNGDGFVTCCPLTDSARLASFLDGVGRRGSIARARQAAAWVVSDARSLMEAALWLLFSLPRDWGGFGLPRGALNQRIYLSREARMIYPHEYCEADLMIPGSHDIFEYLGAAFHRSPERDINRKLALEHDGYNVHELTIYQIVDPRQLYEVARQYARAGQRKLTAPTPRIAQKRRELVNKLIPKRENLRPDGSVVYSKPLWALPAALS